MLMALFVVFIVEPIVLPLLDARSRIATICGSFLDLKPAVSPDPEYHAYTDAEG